jgi:hypothetical protein
MTPAGLPACGSVLCETALPSAHAAGAPSRTTKAPTAPAIDTTLMTRNLDQRFAHDVAKSLPSSDATGTLLLPSQSPERLAGESQGAHLGGGAGGALLGGESEGAHLGGGVGSALLGGKSEGDLLGEGAGSAHGGSERASGAPARLPAEPTSHSSIWLAVGPVVLVLALLILATAYAGGFNIAQWAPPALFVLIVLLTLVLRGGALRLPDRWLALMLAGAWGLAGWAALSATWAAAPAAALEESARLVMYAAILTLPLVALGDLRALRVAAHGVVAGIVLIGFYALAMTIFDGPAIFLAGRLNGPVEYRNATGLLFCLAYWPLIVTAATRGRGRALRGVCLGLAELMLGLAFLTQSRGVLVALGCGALVVMLMGPERVRRAWLALLSVLLLAGAAPWLLRPYQPDESGITSPGDIAVAGRALLVLVLVGVVVGFLLAVFDAGLRAASPAMARVRAGARVGLALVALLVFAGGIAATHGDPAHELSVKWSEFRNLEGTATSLTRYTSTGGQRYDLWRVAFRELQAKPFTGVGAGSYQFDYYLQRRTNRNLDDPHGLLFQLGAELGLIGLALFALIPLGLIGSLWRWWRAAPLNDRRIVCGLTAAGATFIGQSLVDWIWRIPGLSALGMLCFGVAGALLARSASAARAAAGTGAGARAAAGAGAGARAATGMAARATTGVDTNAGASPVLTTRAKRRLSVRRPPVRRLASALVLLACIVLTLDLYLSDFYIRRARAEAGHSPQAQLADARTAASLDPWSTDPHYLQAGALESMGERGAARAQLLQAQRLEPTNQVPFGLLGDFEARGGHYRAARGYYRRALALNPLDVGLQQLARSGGRPQGS